MSGLNTKSLFYNYAFGLIFKNVKDILLESIVNIDESGGSDFKNQLIKYLRSIVKDTNKRAIKRIKMEDSKTNNLIQLADYVASSINRSFLGDNRYRKIILSKEVIVEIWPK